MNKKFAFYIGYKFSAAALAVLATATIGFYIFMGVNSPALVFPVFIVIIILYLGAKFFGSWIMLENDRMIISLSFSKEIFLYEDIHRAEKINITSVETYYKDYQRSEIYKEAENQYEKDKEDPDVTFEELRNSGSQALDRKFFQFDAGSPKFTVLLTLKSGVKYNITVKDADGFLQELNTRIR